MGMKSNRGGELQKKDKEESPSSCEGAGRTVNVGSPNHKKGQRLAQRRSILV